MVTLLCTDQAAKPAVPDGRVGIIASRVLLVDTSVSPPVLYDLTRAIEAHGFVLAGKYHAFTATCGPPVRT